MPIFMAVLVGGNVAAWLVIWFSLMRDVDEDDRPPEWAVAAALTGALLVATYTHWAGSVAASGYAAHHRAPANQRVLWAVADRDEVVFMVRMPQNDVPRLFRVPYESALADRVAAMSDRIARGNGPTVNELLAPTSE